MAQQVYIGATIACSLGVAPSTLVVTSQLQTVTNGTPAATIMDFAPLVNVPPFGMCTTLTNPVVAAATAAKLGVYTPASCVPLTTAPWAPGSPTVLISGQPALTNTCTLLCQWGGVITVTNPGQLTVNVP